MKSYSAALLTLLLLSASPAAAQSELLLQARARMAEALDEHAPSRTSPPQLPELRRHDVRPTAPGAPAAPHLGEASERLAEHAAEQANLQLFELRSVAITGAAPDVAAVVSQAAAQAAETAAAQIRTEAEKRRTTASQPPAGGTQTEPPVPPGPGRP